MKNKKKNKRKILRIFYSAIILFIVFLSLFYFINDKNDNYVLNSVKNSVNNINNIFHFPFVKRKIKCNSNIKLEEENKVLRKEIEKYKKELEIKKTLTDKIVISASTTSRSMANWYNTITINKGKNYGIKKGYAATNNNGLIGKVIRVHKNTSEIKLLSSKKMDNYISSMFIYNDNTYFGLIDKYDLVKNELHMKNVIGDFDKLDNVYVTTSGLSDSFTKGIVIGKIKRIVKDKYGISNDIYITPVSDFNDISIVSIIGR